MSNSTPTASETPTKQGVFKPYAGVWAIPAIRSAVIVGFLSRVPNFGLGLLLTLHIVQHLDPRYSAAGVAVAVFTVAATLSGPWRGHLLDRRGLRRTMIPSLLVIGACVVVAPVLNFYALLALMIPLGAMAFPTFSILRQVMVANAPAELRRTAMSLDSVVVEFAYMAGPILGVVAATTLGTRLALWVFGGAWVLGSAWLTWLNPPIRSDQVDAVPSTEPGPSASEMAALDQASAHDDRASDQPRPGRLGPWLTPGILALFIALIAAGFVLGGTELGTVAALRSMDHPGLIGWSLALWGAGSAVGGIVHGALKKPVPVMWLLIGLGATTVPLAWSPNGLVFAILLFITGLFCAPTLAASAEILSNLVPEQYLGQAMGWHGSATNGGVAMSPPLVGAVMDARGWRWGFVVTGVLGLCGAAALMLATALRRRRSSS